MLDFDKLRTPPGDGDILIEPPPAAWPGLITQNIRQSREYAFTLAGEPAEVAIRETRAAILAAPVIACGHQPGFAHPGVWAKHVVAHQAAQTFGAEGLDFVVDNDAPPSSRSLAVPVIGRNGLVSRRDVNFSSAPAGSPYEGRPPLSRGQIEAIRQQLSDLLGERYESSLMPAYLEGLSDAADGGDSVAQHLAGRLGVDVAFQADLPETRVSEAFGGLFLADLLLNPEPFAVAYNQALADYRQAQEVRSPDRPLPDLGRESERTEAALWVYQPLQRRHRLWVRRSGDRVELFAGPTLIGTIPARDLARNPDTTLASVRPWVIRPRALTLTLWARLLACDLFVHGIGGAKYDRITDDIIRRYYHCPPPAYACVTATLRLPLPVFEVTPAALLMTRRRLRDWHFNPQRYLSKPPTHLVDQRTRLIARSEQLRQMRGPRIERRDIFRAIREINARLVELDPGREADLIGRIDQIKQQLASNEMAASREFFYCLQPPERLAELARRLREALSSSPAR